MIDYGNLEVTIWNSKPFPWTVVDNFLLPGYCEQLRDFSRVTGKNNVFKASDHNCRSTVRYKLKGKPFTGVQKDIFQELHSDKFLNFLSKITGIQKLYPDEGLYGGGFHETHNGGYLKIHTDFNRLPSTGKHRALNLMLYLNPVWQEEWGGCLELWPAGLSEKAHTILPVMNRMVLFQTSEISFHGHPIPLNVPAGVTRKSLAVYYYEDWPAGLKPRPNTHYVNVPEEVAQ